MFKFYALLLTKVNTVALSDMNERTGIGSISFIAK